MPGRELTLPHRPHNLSPGPARAVQQNLEHMRGHFEVSDTDGEILVWDGDRWRADDLTAAAGYDALRESLWPVGSIFMAVVSTNPATLLGFGTWAAFAAGRVLVGRDAGQTEFDTVEETGGAKTHALSTGELASHSHGDGSLQVASHQHGPGTLATDTEPTHDHGLSQLGTTGNTAATGGAIRVQTAGGLAERTDFGGSHSHAVTAGLTDAQSPAVTGTTDPAGSGTAHNNLQPYIVVYMWKRTA